MARSTSPVVALTTSVAVLFGAMTHGRATAGAHTNVVAVAKVTTSVKRATSVTKQRTTTKKRVTTRRRVTTKKRTTTRKLVSTTRSAATTTQLAAPTSAPTPGSTSGNVENPTTLPVAVPIGTLLPVGSTSTTRPATTSTLVAAAFPAPANAPTRATAATLDPYRGVGMWVDRFDWTVRWSGRATPPVNVATMDVLANAGVQTIYIQAAHWSTPGSNDILEPERLIPIIDRAHQLGMYVVAWYLPVWQDVNTDLRKTVAIANLDVDGVNIDIEDRDGVRNLAERTRRLVQYSAQIRSLLPGRVVGNNIYATNYLDGAPDYWPQTNGAPKTNVKWWGGTFPYAEIAPYYDMWMIQNYWTDRSLDSGWRDGYRYSLDNITRLRAALRRSDVPIQLIGGVGGAKMTINDFSGYLQAARESGSTGVSFYDWQVFSQGWAPYLWQFRTGVPDPRFPPTAPPQYVEQPRPTTTLPPVTVPGATVPGTTASLPPTTPPAPVA